MSDNRINALVRTASKAGLPELAEEIEQLANELTAYRDGCERARAEANKHDAESSQEMEMARPLAATAHTRTANLIREVLEMIEPTGPRADAEAAIAEATSCKSK